MSRFGVDHAYSSSLRQESSAKLGGHFDFANVHAAEPLFDDYQVLAYSITDVFQGLVRVVPAARKTWNRGMPFIE